MRKASFPPGSSNRPNQWCTVTGWLTILLCSHRLAAQGPGYYKDVEPIIQAHCAVCHHKGTSAPFSLLSYEDAAKRSSFIRKVVNERYMPPWKADPHYVSFNNERILTDKEIKTIT